MVFILDLFLKMNNSMDLEDVLNMTCTDLQKPNWLAVHALLTQHDFCWIRTQFIRENVKTNQKLKQRWDPGRETFTTLTGSVAEFNLSFLRTSIGDVDIMHWDNNEIAFLDSDILTCIARHKSEELHEIIECYKVNFNPTHPGYVDLHVWGTLKYSFINNKYYLDRNIGTLPIMSRYGHIGAAEATLNQAIHGPAIRSPERLPKEIKDHFLPDYDDPTYKVDWVEAIRCFSWPHQVSNFQQRERIHGWPRIKTIEQCIEAGYDLVKTAHPSSVGLPFEFLQWRISFSRAEVILLRSWTSKQQIIYNMLRYYVKEEILSNKEWIDADKTINSYLIKTKMLQFCEAKPAEWWDNSGVINICCALLRALCIDILKNKCYNYFITNCNLLCHKVPPSTMDNVVNKLIYLTKSRLEVWFWERYRDYFRHILRKDQNLVVLRNKLLLKAVVDTASKIHNRFYSGIYSIYTLVEEIHDTQIHRYENTLRELSRIDCRIIDYFKAHAYLFVCKHILLKEVKKSDSLYVIDLLTALVVANQPHIIRNHPSTFCSDTSVDRILFVRSIQLSEYLSQMTTFPDFCLLAKVLQKTLKSLLKHFGRSSRYFIHSHANLAALKFVTGQPESAISHINSLLQRMDYSKL